MNDPRTPFHAVSHYDAFGNPPFIEKLPPEEEDFGSVEQARVWLTERGGGVIERYCDHCRGWQRVEIVAPAARDTAPAC